MSSTQLRRRGLLLFLVGLALFATAFLLFLLFVNYFSEGYEGRWADVVLGGAWLTLFASVIAGLAALFAFFAAERRA